MKEQLWSLKNPRQQGDNIQQQQSVASAVADRPSHRRVYTHTQGSLTPRQKTLCLPACTVLEHILCSAPPHPILRPSIESASARQSCNSVDGIKTMHILIRNPTTTPHLSCSTQIYLHFNVLSAFVLGALLCCCCFCCCYYAVASTSPESILLSV